MKQFHTVAELGALAKSFRKQAGKKQYEAAQILGIARPSVVMAENNPERNLHFTCQRLIEAFSPYKVEGPFYRLVKK